MGYEELKPIRKDILKAELGLLSERCRLIVQELTDMQSRLNNIIVIIKILEESSNDVDYKGW